MRKELPDVSEIALARFAVRAQRAAKLRGIVTVLITTSAEMRELNRRFRGKDKATDVLSFPSSDESGIARRSRSEVAGDIALSADIAAANAAQYNHSVLDELKILVLHGMLHLAGYDHESDGGEMARRERRLRRELRLPDSLIGRAVSRKRSLERSGSAR